MRTVVESITKLHFSNHSITDLPDIFKTEDNEKINLNGKIIEMNSNFRVYFTTRLPNPDFQSSVYSKLLVVNFNVTESTLSKRLLSHVIEVEQPDLERQRIEMTAEINEHKLTLEQLEGHLLRTVSSSIELILDSSELISLFERTKERIAGVLENIDAATKLFNQNVSLRAEFDSISKIGTQLYFILDSMASINHMYQFSLECYISIFMDALRDVAAHSVSADERIGFIVERLCILLYELGCIGIFAEDKLLYSFQIATKMQLHEGALSEEQIMFFICGADFSSDEVESCPLEWLTDDAWKCVSTLRSCFGNNFDGLVEHLKDHSAEWKQWVQVRFPEEVDMPGKFNTHLSPFEVKPQPSSNTSILNRNIYFQHLMLIRCFHTDRLVNCIKHYITKTMSEDYITSPLPHLINIYNKSTSRTPILLILPKGTDPLIDILQVAKDEERHESDIQIVALGDGCETVRST